MKQYIENAKNWVKKHKKAVILTASGIAAGAGILAIRNNYYVVSRKYDMVTLAKDSTPIVGAGDLSDKMKHIGDLGLAWENSERMNIELSNVALAKMGEVGETLARECKDEDVAILVTYVK